jgi:hypothetical protein
MTTVVTLPIKCSTVKRISDLIPVIAFWVMVFVTVGLMGLLVYAAALTDYPIEKVILTGGILPPICFVILWLTSPYKFECIKE